MTDLTTLLAAITKDGWWIPLDRYCHLYEETREAVFNRRSNGVWHDGVHSKFVKGMGLWVNLIAVNELVAKSALRKVSMPGGAGRKKRSASPSSSAG